VFVCFIVSMGLLPKLNLMMMMMIMMKCSGCLLQHSAQAFSCFGNSSTVLNTSFSLSLINFLLPLSLRIFLNWSLFSLLAVLDPRLLSPYPEHLLPHLSKLQTALLNMQHEHPAFKINSLTLSVSFIHILVFHLLTTLHKSDTHCHPTSVTTGHYFSFSL